MSLIKTELNNEENAGEKKTRKIFSMIILQNTVTLERGMTLSKYEPNVRSFKDVNCAMAKFSAILESH